MHANIASACVRELSVRVPPPGHVPALINPAVDAQGCERGRESMFFGNQPLNELSTFAL